MKEYYPHSRETFRKLIQLNYPEAQSQEAQLDQQPKEISPATMASHLLWMIEKMSEMENDDAKAGRWLGYVIGWSEALGLLNNKQSRDIVRQDVKKITDKTNP